MQATSDEWQTPDIRPRHSRYHRIALALALLAGAGILIMLTLQRYQVPGTDCSAISDNASRLACYDNTARRVATPARGETAPLR